MLVTKPGAYNDAKFSPDGARIVLDDGVGLPPHWGMETSAGLGIRVTRERFQALYAEPGGHDFIISRRMGGGTEVAIRIPLHRAGAEARAIAT